MNYHRTIIFAGIISILIQAGSLPAQQSVEGYVKSCGDYPLMPVVGALVDVEGMGQDSTNSTGYYYVSDTWVDETTPGSEYPLIYDGKIFDLLGRKVAHFTQNQNIDGILLTLTSGVYFSMIEGNPGKTIQKIIVNDGMVIQGQVKQIGSYSYPAPPIT